MLMAKVGTPPVGPHAATLKPASLRCGSTRDVNESGAQKSVSSFVHRPGDGHRQTDRLFTSLTGITGFPGGRRRGGEMKAHTSTAAQEGLHMDDEGCVPRWSIRSSFRTPSLSLCPSLPPPSLCPSLCLSSWSRLSSISAVCLCPLSL